MLRKKVLAIAMVIAIAFTSIPLIGVSADSISKEAAACKELGILIGADSGGVTSAYLSTTPTRIQAFIIFLRLKGLYNDASVYVGENNFKDAASTGWASAYMAYAKSKPDLGWRGRPDGTFAPGEKIDVQAFYKVMLETLGYKQDVDFKYADTLKFAQQIKLITNASQTAQIKNFTVNEVAKAIYNTLNTKPVNSSKKLIDVLVDSNVITAEKAVAAGFILDTEEVKVVNFSSVANNKLQFELDKDIELQKSDIDIVQEGGNSRLSVLSVSTQNRKVSVITTEAKPFTVYEVTVNTVVPVNNMAVKGYKNRYVGLPKDITKPTVKHQVLSSNEILVTFSEEVDRASAESLSNYLIEHDVTVLSAHLNETGDSVVLTTTDMSSNSFYKLTVQNVSDIAGNSIDRYTSLFDGPPRDTQSPSVMTVQSENNSTVLVTFSERVDRLSAENVDNYSIDNGISINSARLDDSGRAVRLTTSLQDSGKIYKLVTQNVLDTSGNAMYRKEYNFTGDSTRPTATVLAFSNNEIKVTYNEKVDKRTAENIANYSIDKGLSILSAALDGTGKVVTLVTSNQTPRELYTVMISGVTDLWGNALNTYISKFGGMAQNASDLSFTVNSNGNNVLVKFNKRVDESSAENVFNYVIDSELGYAAKATLDTEDTGTVVTLLTNSQTSGKMYSITVKGVKDLAGNTISTDDKVCTKRFIGFSGNSDGTTGTLNLEAVVTVDMNTIDLMFSSDLTAEELDSLRVSIETSSGSSYSLPSDIQYSKYFIGSNKKVARVQFKTSSSSNPELFKSGNIFNAKVTGLDRLYIKDSANIKAFVGTGIENEAPRMVSATAINSTAVEVQFSEPVKGLSKTLFTISNNIIINDISVSSDYITDKAVLYLRSSTPLNDSTVYKVTAKSGIKDAAGVSVIFNSSNNYCEFDGTSVSNEAPTVVSDITVLDNATLQLGFSEPIKNITNGSFSVKKVGGSGQFIVSKVDASEDGSVVTVYFNTRYATFAEGSEYELTLSSSIADMQGLVIDTDSRKFSFYGTGSAPDYLEIVTTSISEDNKQIILYANKNMNISELSMDSFELSGAEYYKSSADTVEYNDRMIRINLRNALKSADTVDVKITENGRSQIRDYNGQKLYTEELRINTR